jgi:hypothetical protein
MPCLSSNEHWCQIVDENGDRYAYLFFKVTPIYHKKNPYFLSGITLASASSEDR